MTVCINTYVSDLDTIVTCEIALFNMLRTLTLAQLENWGMIQVFLHYSKTCVKRPLNNRNNKQNKGLNDNWKLFPECVCIL